MTVVAMSHGELSRYDTLLRFERDELRIEAAAMLLGVCRRQVGVIDKSPCALAAPPRKAQGYLTISAKSHGWADISRDATILLPAT